MGGPEQSRDAGGMRGKKVGAAGQEARRPGLRRDQVTRGWRVPAGTGPALRRRCGFIQGSGGTRAGGTASGGKSPLGPGTGRGRRSRAAVPKGESGAGRDPSGTPVHQPLCTGAHLVTAVTDHIGPLVRRWWPWDMAAVLLRGRPLCHVHTRARSPEDTVLIPGYALRGSLHSVVTLTGQRLEGESGPGGERDSTRALRVPHALGAHSRAHFLACSHLAEHFHELERRMPRPQMGTPRLKGQEPLGSG